MLIKEPIRIGTMELKNRLVMPPMFTGKMDGTGHVSDEVCDYYHQRAEDGSIGLIIVEHCYIAMQGKANAVQLSLAEDDTGMERLVDAVHGSGTKVIVQMNHAGSSSSEAFTGQQLVSASAVLNPGKKPGLPDAIPRELTKGEILEIEEQFVQAALRAKKAGFDGVEVHSAHAYLLNQFFSPVTNHRTDEYGCASVENRTRFQCEVLTKVRAAVGPDYPISIRLGGCDYMEGGSTIEDAVEACKLFEKAGADMISLTGGMCRYIRADHTEPGYFGDMSEAVRKAVSVPVLLTGGVQKIEEAEQLLADGKADLIGVGRPLLADGDWAKREMNK